MNIYELIDLRPITSIVIIIILGRLSVIILHVIVFLPINRFFRSLNIKRQGWPPDHCDADGDAAEESQH